MDTPYCRHDVVQIHCDPPTFALPNDAEMGWWKMRCMRLHPEHCWKWDWLPITWILSTEDTINLPLPY